MSKNFKKQVFEIIRTHRKMVTELEESGLETISAIAGAIVKAIKKGAMVYICGNGGSAADAQHIAGELVGRFEANRKALAAVALTTDTSILTSISNDYGYADTFAKQVKALGRQGDVAVGISTSGTAANVIKAIKVAKDLGLKTVGLTGGGGGDLVKLVDFALVVDSSTVARIQEVHITIGHVLCEMVDRMLFQQPT